MKDSASMVVGGASAVELPARRSWRDTYRDYVNVTKPGITMSNAMTTFTAVWVASGGHPDLAALLFTLAGSSLVVMSGCALNNFMDRDIDHLMTRTQGRPLPDGRLRAGSVMMFGVILGVLGVGVLGALVNTLSATMALIGLFFYVIVYTGMTKRTTTLSTIVGSVSGAIPPLIGWTAVTGSVNATGWILFAIMFLWQSPHFLALGMRRMKEYKAAGIPLLPVVYGFALTKRQIVLWTAALVPVSLLLYTTRAVNWIYLGAAIVLGVIYLYKAFRGLRASDDIVWATDMFRYSLIYLTVLSIAMVIAVY